MQKLKSGVESLLNIEVLDKKTPAAARDLLKAIACCDRIYEYGNKCCLHPKGKVVWHGLVESDHVYTIEGRKHIWKHKDGLSESAYLIIYRSPLHDNKRADFHWFGLDVLEAEVKQLNEQVLPSNKVKILSEGL